MKNSFAKNYDIIIAGAGMAGISAALAAARQGYSVCLLDKQTLIGGLATSGMVFVYLPLCDGENHQVTFGIAEELLLAGLNYGPYDISSRWGGKGAAVGSDVLSEGSQSSCATQPRDRYAAQFSPAGMVLALDTLLKEADVDLWLDTRLCDVRVDNGDVTAVEVENDSGWGLLTAQRFIDASGDSHLVRHAGGNIVKGKNINNIWLVSHDPFVESIYCMGKPVLMQPIQGRREALEAQLTGREFTDFVRDGWGYARSFYEQRWQEEHTDRFHIYPITLPSMPQYRTTARIDGVETVFTDEYNRHQETSIGLIGDWRHAGRIWETPYGALLPKGIGNTLAAGRCIASDGDAWEAYRVIPACSLTGEVAGTAAALSIRNNVQPVDLPLGALRNALCKNGFRFHREEIISNGYAHQEGCF